MAFLFFGNNKNKKNITFDDGISLVIDIESGSVRGVLVFNTKTDIPDFIANTPHILYTTRALIKNAPHSDSAQMTAMMLRAVGEVVEDISSKALPNITIKDKVISKVHYVFSSPWVISKTKTVTVTYPKDTEISKANISEILNAEHHELEEKFKMDHQDSSGADLSFIEEKIFEIKLNGYPVTHVEGKRARELAVSFAITISSKNILASVREIVTNSLHIRDQECHSSLLLQYTAFRNLITARNDYIAAHIHHELSDVIVVKGGVCSIMASFPFGSGTFMRKVSGMVKQSETLTSSALSLKTDAKLSKESEKEVTTASDPVVREWASQFWKTLSLAGEKQSLPRFLFLSVHDHYPYFEEALKEESPKEDGQEVALDITPLDEVLLEKAVIYKRTEDENALTSMYAFALNPTLRSNIM